MAYQLSGSGQYWQASSAAVGAAPLSMACWFSPEDITNEYVLLGIGRTTTGNHYFYLSSNGAAAGDPLTFGARAGGGAFPSTRNGVVANQWQHGAGVASSSSNRIAYLNGVAGSANTTNVVPSSLNTTDIGQVTLVTPVTLLKGKIAEVGFWSAALTASEIASLALGVAPIKVRPQSLVFYAPLIREVQDLRGGLALTQTGSPTVIAHPRTFY